MGPIILSLPDLILFSMLGISLYSDCRYRLIYNRVVLPAAVLGFVFQSHQNGILGLLEAANGFFLGLGLLLIPFLLGGMGAGDLKLLGAIGALKGPAFTWNAFLFTALVGGGLSVIFLVYAGQLVATLRKIFLNIFWLGIGIKVKRNLSDWEPPPDGTNSSVLTIPYGVAIVIGTLICYYRAF